MSKRVNVVLFEPEIPTNTGNIMRSCVGFDVTLHLIKPYGFSLDEKHLRRAGLDYIKYLDLREYDNLDDFLTKNKGDFYFLTRYGHKEPCDINFNESDNDVYLIFGKESTGLPYKLLQDNLDRCFRIPTTDKVRSLNLSNCAAILMYLATSQIDNPNLIKHEPDTLKGEFFIDNYTNEQPYHGGK